MNAAQAKIIGTSPLLLAAKERALRVAPTSYAVIIYGESGTGKELFARLVHGASGRADKPFVTVNCGAIPRELAESELFGHERGAFTGAVVAHPGAFQRADGGTLFLDEIGDLPLDLQVKLLRALQWGEIHPLGADTSRKVDVRIITATHRDLTDLVAHEKFREDLYYRLAVYAITLPPLRDRGPDIITIATHVLRRECPGKRLTRGAQRLLLESLWPGNVRQLENVLKAATVDAPGKQIQAAVLRQLSLFPTQPPPVAAPAQTPPEAVISFIERHGRVTTSDVVGLLGLGRTRGSELLAGLERDGLVTRMGTGRATHYVPASGVPTKSAPAADAKGPASTPRLTDLQRAVLEAVRSGGPMPLRDILKHLPGTASSATVRDNLHRLKELALVDVKGWGRGALWLVPARDR